MTRQRRQELEARVIANRRHEPAAFTLIVGRPAWVQDTGTARVRRPIRGTDADDTAAPAVKKVRVPRGMRR